MLRRSCWCDFISSINLKDLPCAFGHGRFSGEPSAIVTVRLKSETVF